MNSRVSVKISGSGQNVTIVPVLVVGFPFRSLPTALPRSNSIVQVNPSRATSTVSRRESALTTETPTPCRPPETA